MSQFYPLQIKTLVHDTEESTLIEFDVPHDIQEVFKFRAGQYVIVRTTIGGVEVRRSYSLCSSPNQGSWRIGVKAIEAGLFSNYAKQGLRVGDLVDVSPPEGNFVLQGIHEERKNYVAFAAGSGITPVISQIRQILKGTKSSRVLLFYGNRTSKAVMFREELEALKNSYMDRFSLFHVLSRERISGDMFYGRINASKCSEYANQFFDISLVHKFMICGPFEMTMDIKEYLGEARVTKDRILTELFFVPEKNQKTSTKDSEIEVQNESIVSVKIDGDRFDFGLQYGGDSILDAAIKQGADLPFACKGGVCSTCKAKLITGEVDMDVNYALEPDELAKGYVLTCQSHPRSAKIEIDFDQKS